MGHHHTNSGSNGVSQFFSVVVRVRIALETDFWATYVGEFLDCVKVEKPTLSVGDTISWLEPPSEQNKEEQAEGQHFSPPAS